MDPSPDGLKLMLGKLLVKPVDPPHKLANHARVGRDMVRGVSAEQAIPFASQGQKRHPELRVFRVEECRLCDASASAREGRPDPVGSGLGQRSRLTW
jgi:hypothetical protein